MSEQLTYCGELTVLKCWCGIRHAVPEELRRHQLRQRDNGQSVDSIYCPLGHTHVPSGEGESARLRRELDSKQRALDAKERYAQSLREQRDAAVRRESAQKAAKTRIKNRIAKGVCPCCNRSFENLHRHMTSQHPDYTKQDA